MGILPELGHPWPLGTRILSLSSFRQSSKRCLVLGKAFEDRLGWYNPERWSFLHIRHGLYLWWFYLGLERWPHHHNVCRIRRFTCSLHCSTIFRVPNDH